MQTPREYIEHEMRTNVPLSSYTTFHIGGPAEYFVTVENEEQLVAAIEWANAGAFPVTVLGGGSNVLVSDRGVKGLVVHLLIKGFEYDEQGEAVFVHAGAGEVFDDVVAYAVSHGWWGLENLSSIPGYVGATPVQHGGAYGVERSQLIVSVEAYDVDRGVMRSFSNEECLFEYRDSFFKSTEGKRFVITRVTYKLSKYARPQLQYRDLEVWKSARDGEVGIYDIRQAVQEIRARKFPDWHTTGTAGSFFKNPVISLEQYKRLCVRYPELPGHAQAQGGVKVSLGWILDRVLALRGYQIGNVGTYENQALVLVNHGGATAHDVEVFARAIQKKVFDATGIPIEWEVTMVS